MSCDIKLLGTIVYDIAAFKYNKLPLEKVGHKKNISTYFVKNLNIESK